MNLKFFILGLYVLVSIAQVKATENEAQNGEINDKGEEIDRSKRQEQSTTETIKQGRKFNTAEAIGNVAQQPMQQAMKQAMHKLFATYSDPSKPFGPTYDTTWGSAPPENRRANEEEIKMSTMVQPPAGQSGYYTYQVHKRPSYYGNQFYRNSLESALPLQTGYDNNMNGMMTGFSGSLPGYYPYNTYQQQSLSSQRKSENPQQYFGSHHQNRRAGNDDHLEKKIKDVLKKSPEEIKKLIAQILSQKKRGSDDGTMRKGFTGDDRSSEEKSSGELASNIQVEFNGPQGDAVTGNRKFTGKEDPKDIQDMVHKLTVSTYNGLSVIIGYLQAVLETGNMEQIGERFVQFYEVLKHLKEYFD